jgi:hypothetical protein
MQLIQYRDLKTFSTVITNNFIREDVSLKYYSLNCLMTMGFVLLSTHDDEEKIFTLDTIKPISSALYDTLTMWWKYCDKIIPPNQTLKRLNKVSLHEPFCDSLVDYLHTDLDGNLSFMVNPHCVPKFTEYFLHLLKGMSETQLRVQIFDRTMENSTFKKAFIDHMKTTAILGTMILLSIFTIFFTKALKSIQCWNQR